MPRYKANLPSAGTTGDQTVRPPADLWEQMDAICQEKFSPAPPGAFTITEFAEKYGITHQMAETRINRLIGEGVVADVGRHGTRNAKHYCLRG